MAIVEPTLKSINSILGLNLDGERLLLVYGGPSGNGPGEAQCRHACQ